MEDLVLCVTAVDFICEQPDIKAISFVGSDQAVSVPLSCQCTPFLRVTSFLTPSGHYLLSRIVMLAHFILCYNGGAPVVALL